MQYPMINKKYTSKRLKYLLQKHHYRAKYIQEYLSLSCVQTVYRWLEGSNIPNIDHLYALSKLFHVSIDSLIDYQSDSYQDMTAINYRDIKSSIQKYVS